MKDLVSIIVPVYNSERYIRRCLESIINQSYSNLEIIVVNDGSTDNSINILNEYEKKDSRVIIYNQNNSGVSVARNRGMEQAKGEYILFVDSDDYIQNNAVKMLIESQQKNLVDGAICGVRIDGENVYQKSDTEVIKKTVDEKGEVIKNADLLKHVLTIDPEEELLGYMVRYMYKREIIEKYNIKFDEVLKISEDYKFIVNYLLYTNNIALVKNELYIYVLNNNSSTAKYMPSLECDMSNVNKWIEKNIYPHLPEVITNHKGCIANTYLNFIQNIAKIDSEYTFFEGIKIIYKKKKEYAPSIKYTAFKLKCRKKAKIAFLLFSANLDILYFALYYIKKRLN